MHKRAVAAVALLGLVVLATVAILVARQEDPSPPPPEPTAPPAPATLLVQVRDPQLLVLGSVLMGVDGQRTRLDQLWWTPEWWIDQIGPQEVSAADLGRKPVQDVMQTVTAQVQVPVDDAWVMDRLAFAGLIDAVGGVRVDIGSATAYLDDQGLPVFLEAGPQTLSGSQAADYVLDSSLRDEAARLARFQAVWDQVLRRFPMDEDKARTLVVSLGVLSKSTLGADELAAFLAQARTLRVAGDHAQAQVPLDRTNLVRVQPPQGVRAAFALNEVRMPRRMADMFPGYPRPEQPIARVAAAAYRSEDVVAMREQLVVRGWLPAWAGRTQVGMSSVTVSPTVADPQVTQLEQAVGLPPVAGVLPWGDAQVDVARAVGS